MLKIKGIFIYTFLFFVFVSSSISQTIEKDTCLKNHLRELKNTYTSDDDFSDLKFLKETLKGVDIVALGEVSHGDGTTFETKVRLVKFLHEELGFDVLAFESGLYDCKKAWELITQGETADSTAGKGVFAIWSKSSQVAPLFQYIENQKNGKYPLILAGFDFQFTASASKDYLVADFISFLNGLGIKLGDTDDFSDFTRTLQSLIEDENYSENISLLIKCFDRIEQELYRVELTREVSFWLQWIKSTKNLVTDRNHRDKYMAENFIWLKDQYYPNKKIICWGASSHFMFNSSHLNVRFLDKFPTMGDSIKIRYNNRFYTIGFTDYAGERGTLWEEGYKIEPAKPGSLEDVINRSCVQNCFIDFHEISNECFLKQNKILTRPFWFYKRMVIPKVMDGLIFIKEMKKSTSK